MIRVSPWVNLGSILGRTWFGPGLSRKNRRTPASILGPTRVKPGFIDIMKQDCQPGLIDFMEQDCSEHGWSLVCSQVETGLILRMYPHLWAPCPPGSILGTPVCTGSSGSPLVRSWFDPGSIRFHPCFDPGSIPGSTLVPSPFKIRTCAHKACPGGHKMLHRFFPPKCARVCGGRCTHVHLRLSVI